MIIQNTHYNASSASNDAHKINNQSIVPDVSELFHFTYHFKALHWNVRNAVLTKRALFLWACILAGSAFYQQSSIFVRL